LELVTGIGISPALRARTASFLGSLGLDLEDDLDFTVVAAEGPEIVGTGSRKGGVLRCIGVSPEHRGEGVSATVLTALVSEAFSQGIHHLFLYTKPENEVLFAGSGFHTVASTGRAALMENRREGAVRFAAGLVDGRAKGTVGCVVANANPFTRGHLYLAGQAAKLCDFLYFLVLSEDRSLFSAETRLRLAQEGLAHLPNVAVRPTGPYLISQATFPEYFIKDKADVSRVYYDLDIAVFLKHYVPALGISARFAGTEPTDPLTAGYNVRMRELLEGAGVRFEEIERKKEGAAPVSASAVRRFMAKGDLDSIQPLVPEGTFREIRRMIDEKR